MSAKAELKKVRDRLGREPTEEETELEEARELWHRDRRHRGNRERFRKAQDRVARRRTLAKLEREEEGPPPGAEVVTDAAGKVIGWHMGADAVAMPGGVK